MSSLDSLSDGEIRTKLAQLGYPVGPITATTRKVLLKKLKHLLEEGKSPGSGKKASTLAKYSSEEESEDDGVSSPRNRRSMPPPPPKSSQKSAVKRRSLSRKSQELEDDTDNISIHSETVNSEFHNPSASSTFNSSEFISGLSTNKYSPKNIGAPANHKTSPDNHRRTNSAFSAFSSNLQTRFSSRKSQDAFDTGSDTDGIDEIESTQPSSTKSKNSYSSYIPSISGSPFTSQTRSRFQPQSFGGDFSKFSSKSGLNSETNSHSSPFSSDFVRRLSAASAANKSGSGTGTGLPTRLLDVKESDDEDTNSTPTYSHQNTGNFRKGTTSSLEGKIWRNATTVSMVLLFFVAVFFCVVGIMYLNVRFKETPITTTETNFPVCKFGEKPGATCILNNEIQETMKMFRKVYEVLNDRAAGFACGSDVETSVLTEDQITQMMVESELVSVWDIEKHFGNIRVLIGANPQWGVEVKEIKEGSKVKAREYNIPSPSLPLGCYLYSVFFGIVGSALRVIVVVGILLGLVKAAHWWMDRQERSRKQVFKMVESIIEILSSHQQSSAGDHYLAISHVRDQLIAPHQRDKMAAVWEAAVAFLEENDSRVRTEVQQVAGEEFRVWRWLPGPKPNGKRKVWQGQAFETMEGSVNSLPISPTPCLKIRHMFDSDVEVGEDWMTRVQDAILEKCEGVNVYHIAVDKNSHEGCVYVKCATPQDAGRAYRALHGSWFDSKLVTVKYLRLERYHERFPDAVRANRPLRPSNDRKLSLQ